MIRTAMGVIRASSQIPWVLVVLVTCVTTCLGVSAGFESKDAYRSYHSSSDDAATASASIKMKSTTNPYHQNTQRIQFSQPSYNGSIHENSLGRVYVATPRRMGILLPPSTPVDIEYDIVGGDERNIFKAETRTVKDFCFMFVRTRTGIRGMLNRELDPRFQFRLRVSAKLMFPNETELEAFTDVVVTVLDVNEFSPLYSKESFEFSVPEDTPLHASIGQITASDADAGINGEIYYSFVQETLMFAVHPTSGVVSLTRPISFSHKRSYELDVVARDRAFSLAGRRTKLKVNILPINFNPPTIKVQPHQSLVEKGNIGSVFAILTVTDTDVGKNGIVDDAAIANDPQNIFRLVADDFDGTYNLEVASRVDRENISPDYNITVTAWDRGSPVKTSSVVIPVRVQDINDNPPEFEKEVYIANVSEVILPGTPLLFVSAKDRDIGPNADILYSIVGGVHRNYFEIDSQFGLIRLTKPLDYERENTIVLYVQAEDQALTSTRLSGRAKVVVYVEDFNDNSPVFDMESDAVELKEQTPAGTKVITVSATDADSGDNGKVSFSIVNFDSMPFEIDAFSGEVTTKSSLDYETNRRVFYLHVRASDWGSPFRRETDVVVAVKLQDVNDNSPEFEKIKCSGYLSKDSPMKLEVIGLNAIDFDSDNLVSYSITDGNDDGCFGIDATSGMLFVNCDMSNFDEGKRHLAVVASDGQYLSIPVTVDLNLVTSKRNQASSMDDVRVTCEDTDVIARFQRQIQRSNAANANNKPPVLRNPLDSDNKRPEVTQPLPARLDVEESKVVGDIVLDFRDHLQDLDSGYAGFLTFVISGGDDVHGKFKLDTFSGQLIVYSDLDYETKPEYTLTLTAVDHGRPQMNVSRDLTISVLDINDNAPRFGRTIYTREISESALINTTLLKVDATDRDQGENGRIQYSIVASDGTFSIGPSSSTIRLVKRLDRESRPRHILIVQAEDSSSGGKLSSTAVVNITVTDYNDNPPAFVPDRYTVRVREDLPIGSLVTTVTGHDPDLGSNGEVAYSFTDGIQAQFQIDSLTGCVRIKRKLDYEKRQVYTLGVTAEDRGQPALTSQCSLVVEVMDVDENLHAPKFRDYIAKSSVAENLPIGSYVTEVRAEDNDDPRSGVGQVRYSIQDGTGLGRFNIDANGTIRTSQVLDRETHAHFWLTIIAQDLALVPKFARLEVLVEVDDVNDNIPQSLEPAYYASVPENSLTVQSVVRVRAVDGDFDGGQPLSYSITSGNPQAFFAVDPYTGVISTTSRTLDREKQDEHSLEITISDRGEPPLSSTTRVLIKVVDENDNKPRFLDRTSRVSAFAAPYNGTDVFLYRAMAHDRDEGRNGLLDYLLKSPKDSKLFRVEKKTGKVFITGDLVAGDSFELLIKAVDHGFEPLKAILRLQVDVYPHRPDPSRRPKFGQRWYNESIAETDKPGQFIVLLSAQEEIDAMLLYSIIDGNYDDTFSIQPDYGSIFLARPVDWETRTNFTLTVSVTDGLASDTAKVFIDVIDSNDNDPVFSHKIYRTNVSENAAIGTHILRVTASDRDRTKRLLYSLTSAASSRSISKFSIGAESGVLVISDSLDHEDLTRHLLTIMVRDQGIPSKRGFARVDVRVMDSNDHKPRFLSKTLTGQVYETAALGTSVVQVRAVDRDRGKNAELTYSILSGNADNTFNIDPYMGIISVAKELDINVHSHFRLKVKVTDNGSPALSADTWVNIEVTISTNSPPKFSQKSYTAELNENLPAETLVTAVQADSLSTVSYSIVDGNRHSFFAVNPNSGVISTLKPIDFEQLTFFNLTISATNIISASQTVNVAIHIMDVNDNYPQFQSSLYIGSLSENANIGSMVLDKSGNPLVVRALDKDSNNNGRLIYTIQDREALQVFAIDANTGALHTIAQLDYEMTKVYNFSVRVSDNGQPQLQAKKEAHVVINVKDTNDCPPTFEKPTYKAEVLLPTYPDVAVLRLKATDLDSVLDAPALSFSIISGNEEMVFGIDAANGVIHVVKATPGEKDYTLSVQVSDGKFHSICQVSITVQPESEAGIRFTKDIYETSVGENKVLEENLVVIQPVGLPLGSHVVFTLLNNLDLFMVGKTSGVLSTTGVQFDREEKDNYTVVVRVEPNNPSMKSAHALVHVTVRDDNDNSPMFLNLPYRCTVSTKAKKRDVIQKLIATDADIGQNAELKYTLVDTMGYKFALNPHTQEIVVMDLDERDENQELTLRVIAEDRGSPPMSAVASIHVHIIDSSSPRFDFSSYKGSIPENSAPHTPILTLQAESPYGQKLLYSISQGDKYGDFSVDFNTDMASRGPCYLSVVGQLDYEDKAEYTLMVRATDIFSGNFAEVLVNIAVEDTNDNSPVFTSLSYTQTLSEATSTGTKVLTLNATDADSGPNALVLYSLAPAHPESRDAEHFHVKAETGDIILKKALDHEQQKEFQFLAVAMDNGNPVQTGTALVTVKVLDLNDNPPAFSQPSYSCSITDLATRGQLVFKVSAFDPDDSDTDNLSYRIIGGNTKYVFDIDSSTGVITLSEKRKPDLNALYSLNVSASDGVFTSFASVAINVHSSNHFAPVFSRFVYNTVVSEIEQAGTSLITARASDKDRGENGMLTYAIMDDINSLVFSIDADTGEIFTKKVLDREEKSIYRFKISATDDGGKMGFATVIVRVKDENDNVPEFLMEDYKASVTNTAKPGTSIIQVLAEDEDEGRNAKLLYGLHLGEDTEVSDLFAVDAFSGVITNKASLLRSENKVFQFFIKCQDQGETKLENHVPVEILVTGKSAYPPKFPDKVQIVAVNEKEKPETMITSVRADSLIPVTYSLVQGHTPKTNSPVHFVITSRGHIYLKRPLDRETTDSYSLFVRAETKTTPALVDHMEVKIQVHDFNDHKPVFTCSPYTLTLPENTPLEHSVLQLLARDEDKEVKPLAYSFGPGMSEMASKFSIDAKSGWIVLLTELDREKQSEYNLTVVVWDSARRNQWKNKQTPGTTSTTSVLITVTDVNDNAPTFRSKRYAAAVNEAALPGTIVVQLETSDLDIGRNADVSYYITEGNQLGQFQVHSSGELFVNKPLDRESQSEYRLTVAATDGAFVSYSNIDLEILDDNDNPPICKKPLYQVFVNEDLLMGNAIAQVVATDADEAGSINTKLTHSLTGPGSEFFSIDKNNGLIYTAKLLDRETRPKFRLTATVQDTGGLSCTTSVMIFLKDVNDNAPEFPPGSLRDSYSIKEDAKINTLVTRVMAVDADIGANSEIRYAFSPDSPAAFVIDQSSGIISLRAGLDRERNPSYNMTVIAYNPTSHKLSSEAFVYIRVLDVNDNPPEFERSSYHATLSEAAEIGQRVIKVRATSLDIGVNADISYKIAAGNEIGKFVLDEESGELRVSEPLDHELSREFFLTIVATDKGDPPLTNTAIVSINVTDTNDNPPVFSHDMYPVEVLETVESGTEIFKVLATDSDSPPNSKITYSIVDGNRQNCFIIGPSDGIIQVREPMDREKISSYSLVVQAHDSGVPMLFSTTRVNVMVQDANDNPPVFSQDSYKGIVQEGRRTGIEILTLVVSDEDLPENGPPFTFEITSGNDDGEFHIDQDGKLTTAGKLSKKGQDRYNLLVRVYDSGKPQLFSEKLVRIEVVDDSLYPPEVRDLSISIRSCMDGFPGGVIGKVEARDRDPYDRTVFSIISPNSHLFDIHRDDGRLIALTGLDAGGYIVNVSVSDGKFTSYGKVKVNVVCTSKEMLENAITIQFENIIEEQFYANFKSEFQNLLKHELDVRNSDIEIINVQSATASMERSRRDVSVVKARYRRNAGDDLDVLFAVRKSFHRFFNKRSLKRKVERIRGRIQSVLGLRVSAIFADKCKKSSCDVGTCVGKVKFDESTLVPVLVNGASFVSAKHYYVQQCVCLKGVCEEQVCGEKTCSANEVCQKNAFGDYVCQCPEGRTGDNCATVVPLCSGSSCPIERPMTYAGKSYSKWRLQHSTKKRFSLRFRIRTRQSKAVLMYAKGKVDYSILKIESGKLVYQFDCGSGEGLVRIPVDLSDGQWHTVELDRNGREAELSLDSAYTALGVSPGVHAILNVDTEEIFFGAEVDIFPNGYREISNGFEGCMEDIRVFNIPLPFSGNNEVAHALEFELVEFHCQDYPAKFAPGGDACSSNPCLNGGQCKFSGLNSYFCVCAGPYTGTKCELNPAPCNTNPCKRGGLCEVDLEVPNSYSCDCKDNILGVRCSYGQFCRPNPCKHGGTCVEGPTAPLCDCPIGYEGLYCDKTSKACQSSPCANGGVCQNLKEGSYFCNCTGDFNGKNCEYEHIRPASGAVAKSSSSMLYGIISAVLVLILIAVIVIGCLVYRRHKRERRRQNVTPGIADSSSQVLLSNIKGKACKLSNPDLSVPVEPLPCRPPPVPTRPASYTPSTQDSYNTLNNLDSVGNYGSAADDLENTGTQGHLPTYTQYLESFTNPRADNTMLRATPPPHHLSARSKLASESDSIQKGQWEFEYPNILEHYNEGDKKHSDTMGAKRMPGIHSPQPSPSIRHGKSQSNNNPDTASLSSLAVSESEDDLNAKPFRTKGYHWDTSDWAPGPSMPNISEIPIHEILDSPASSQPSDDCNANAGFFDDGLTSASIYNNGASSRDDSPLLSSDEHRNNMEEPGFHSRINRNNPNQDNVISGLDYFEDSDYVGDSEYAENEISDPDEPPPSYADHPNYEQLLRDFESSCDLESSYKLPEGLHTHPDQYLPYFLDMDPLTEDESPEEGPKPSDRGAEGGRDIVKDGHLALKPPKEFMTPGYPMDGYQTDVDPPSQLSFMDDMSMSMGGFTSNNSCSDISGVCDIEDSEVNASDMDDEYTPLNPDQLQTRV